MADQDSRVEAVQLDLLYDGPALKGGLMEAREVGTAVTSAALLIERASELLYGKEARVTVQVVSEFRYGSFGVEFQILAQSGEAITVLTRDDIRLILEVVGLLGGGGLIAFLRWLAGRQPDKVLPQGGGGTTIIVNDQSINLSAQELHLYRDVEVRRGVAGIVAPLKRPGIEKVRYQVENDEPGEISKGESETFIVPAEVEQPVSENAVTAVVEIVGISFKEGNKWKFSHSGGVFWAAISDNEFLEKVRQHDVVFGQGDGLRVNAIIRTTRLPEGGFDHEWEIVRVVEHIPAGPSDQLEMRESA